MADNFSYTIDIFNEEDFDKLINLFNNLTDAVQSTEYMEYISEKCKKELEDIMSKKLRTEDYETQYRQNNHFKVSKDELVISNDSMVDLSNLKPETLANYPEGLSLSQLIEFGTGIPRN